MQERSKRSRGMVSEPRFLISAFLEDVLNEIATFGGPKASKAGCRETQSAPRKQYNSILRPARKTCGSESVAIGTAAAQGRGEEGPSTTGNSEVTLVKLQFSAKTLQTAREVSNFQNRDFCGVPIYI